MSHRAWVGGLVVIIVAEALLTGIIPLTRSELYGELAKGSTLIYLMAAYAFVNIFVLEAIQAVKGYVVLRASLKARETRTHAVCLGLTNRTSDAEIVPNAPQRVQEDIKLSYINRYTAWSEYFISGIILVYLIAVNWDHTSLILASLVYSVISIAIAYLFSPRLTEAEKHVQRTEAEFRDSLVTSLTPIGLNPAQEANIKAGKIGLHFNLFTKLQGSVLQILPFVLLTPALVAGGITFQEIMEHANTFSIIVVNAAILISIFPVLIRGKASEERVKELHK
jgi:ABC-type uncharacterized transport system fused permease/ATPase subunit